MGIAWLATLFDPRDPAAQFWIGVGGLILGIGSAVAGVVHRMLSRRADGKRLTYQTVSDVGLINDVKDLGPDIELTLDGHTVNDARLVIVRLANAGAETVSEADLHGQPIRVQFEPPSLIRCAIHDTDPPNL